MAAEDNKNADSAGGAVAQLSPDEMARQLDEIIELAGSPDLPVAPGMLIGVAKSLSPFTLGKGGGDETLPQPPYYTVDVGSREVRATIAGIIGFEDSKVIVRPLVTVSDDNLTAFADIYAYDFMGNAVPPILYERNMRDQRISLPMDIKAVAAAIAAVRESGIPHRNLTICSGNPARSGRNGKLESLVTSRAKFGTMDDQGTLDYRERGSHPSVTVGTAIARYYPPTKGQRGIDVFGNEMPAKDGEERPVTLGDNITATTQEDGTILYEATADGLADVTGRRVGVTTVLHIAGDVDMESGNIHVDTGSVHVKGSIRTGFTVNVAGHLIVDGVIESAMVTAGGDIEVRSGIAMEGRNLVKAAGNITSGYAHDAVIEAGGDIQINGGIINSFVTAKGIIKAEGNKGVVQGGSLVAGRGVDLTEAGSDLGVQTAITISLDVPEMADLARERDDIRSKLKRLEPWLGQGTPRAILLQTPETDRLIVAEMLRVRARLEERLKVVLSEHRRLATLNNHALSRAPVIIRRTAHNGVRLRIGDRTLLIDHPLVASKHVWDPADRQIVALSLV